MFVLQYQLNPCYVIEKVTLFCSSVLCNHDDDEEDDDDDYDGTPEKKLTIKKKKHW